VFPLVESSIVIYLSAYHFNPTISPPLCSVSETALALHAVLMADRYRCYLFSDLIGIKGDIRGFGHVYFNRLRHYILTVLFARYLPYWIL
jgi:hypothetical protein